MIENHPQPTQYLLHFKANLIHCNIIIHMYNLEFIKHFNLNQIFYQLWKRIRSKLLQSVYMRVVHFFSSVKIEAGLNFYLLLEQLQWVKSFLPHKFILALLCQKLCGFFIRSWNQTGLYNEKVPYSKKQRNDDDEV